MDYNKMTKSELIELVESLKKNQTPFSIGSIMLESTDLNEVYLTNLEENFFVIIDNPLETLSMMKHNIQVLIDAIDSERTRSIKRIKEIEL